MIDAIVLACGFSRRLGVDKLTLKLNDKMVIQYLIDELVKLSFNKIFIVTNNSLIANVFYDNKVIIVNNQNSNDGQSSSIIQGINHADASNDYMFFVADQPLLNSNVIKKLINTFNEYPDKIVVPVSNNKTRNPVIFPNRFKEQLLLLKGDTGGKQVLKNNPDSIKQVYFEDETFFLDIDNELDLQNIKSIIGDKNGII